MRLQKLEQRVKDFSAKNSLIPQKSKVLIAVSGGADSVCLLYILHKLSKKNNDFEIAVCTINHNLRDDAKLEVKFVRELCLKLGVLCFAKNVRFKETNNVEERARELRYEALNNTLKEWGGDLIATAHNKNDQAETLLLRIIRGTAVRGLGGIPLKNDNIIRPLLGQSREDILYYMKENAYSFMTDKSNFSYEYTRNRVRMDLLPKLEDEYNVNILEMFYNLAESALDDNECLDTLAKGFFYDNYEYRGLDLLVKIYEKNLHAAIIKRVFRQAFIEINGLDKDITSEHYKQLLRLKTGERLSIFKNLMVIHCGNSLYLFTKNEINDTIYNISQIMFDETYDFKGHKVHINCDVKSIAEKKNKQSFGCTVDKDMVKGNLSLSSVTDGDRIIVDGKTKKIQDILVDSYVPRHLRKSVPILLDDEGVIAVLGYRVNDRVKTKEDTKEFLNILVEWENSPWTYQDLDKK